MATEIEGFYAAYMTGQVGQGFAMFIVQGGRLVGADPLGVQFDGLYTSKPDGSGYEGDLTVKIPPNGTTIQGVTVGSSGMTYPVSLEMPRAFTEQEALKITTPLGPVNVRMVKLRAV